MEIYVIGCTSTSSSSFCLHTINTKTCLCISDELHHPPTMNYTLSTLKAYVYAWVVSLIILLPQTTHNQHQNMCLCIGNGLHHPPTMNYTLSTPKQSKPNVFPKAKLQQQLCIQTMIIYKGRWCFSRSQTPLYILIKRKQVKKLLKNYPPHGSPNNKKETKSQRNKITWFPMWFHI